MSMLKKSLAILLAIVMITGLVACGGSATAKPQAAESAAQAEEKEALAEAETPESAGEPVPASDDRGFQTLGDVFACDIIDSSFSEYLYACVFETDGVYYRAVAELPADVSEALWALDFFDENYDSLVREAVAPLDIMLLDNLTELIPPQEELDTLVGRNVQELVDEGWYCWYWNMDEKELGMYYGPFSYRIIFDGTPEDPENFDAAQSGALTVRSVEYDGIGDATSYVLDLWTGEDFGGWTGDHFGGWTGADFGELPPEDFGE